MQDSHIYQVLEDTKGKKSSVVQNSGSDSSDGEPPPVPPFCPAGGDSPGKKTDTLPDLPQEHDKEYAEIIMRGMSL